MWWWSTKANGKVRGLKGHFKHQTPTWTGEDRAQGGWVLLEVLGAVVREVNGLGRLDGGRTHIFLGYKGLNKVESKSKCGGVLNK